MNTLLNWLDGRKTYFTCLVVIVLLLGQWGHWWTIPPEIYASLAAIALAFLRAGVKREIGSLLDKAEDEEPQTAATRPGGAPRPILAMAMLVGLVGLGFLAGCGTLDKSGVYNGDKALYDADTVLATSYDVLHSFVKWEYDNRAVLAATPEIKQYADTIRTQAPHWFQSAVALRDAYKANPNSGTLGALQTAIAVIHQAITEATQYYARAPGAVQPLAK